MNVKKDYSKFFLDFRLRGNDKKLNPPYPLRQRRINLLKGAKNKKGTMVFTVMPFLFFAPLNNYDFS